MFSKVAFDLELDKVLSEVSSFALSRNGAEKIRRSIPVAGKAKYSERQYLVESMLKAKEEAKYKSLYAEAFPDIGSSFETLKSNPTAPLEGVSLYDIGCFVRSALVLRRVIEMLPVDMQNPLELSEKTENAGLLQASQSEKMASQRFLSDAEAECEPKETSFCRTLSDILPPVAKALSDLADEVFKILSDNGDVKETYPTIQNLIKKAESKRAERAGVAASLMSANMSVMNGDTPVLRDGRLVLPVKRESHSVIQGFVQSVSGTGSTVFMEPYALTRINNEVELAWQEVEIEKHRLFAYLTGRVRSAEEELEKLHREVAEADFLYGFASWVEHRQCSKVGFSDEYKLNLIEARHPLLKDFCVPVDISVAKDIKAVVFTGPNAGGKTVTIKTAGLFVLINQICGYVPASEGTSMSLFDKVFTDIGDEQSIENGLSTFSAHMKETSYILKHITDNSLVILDELGSGTDPAEGAALGRAILEYCVEKAPLTLITSHYGVLKQYAYASDNIINASMEFNEKTGEPTFRVINGLSGESHAIDAAIRMRMPKKVVNNAKTYLGKEAVKISNIIRGLEEKRKEAEEKGFELERRLREVEKERKALEEKSRKLDVYEANLREELYAEYNDFVRTERKNLENTVKELREGEINREKTLRVKAEIERLSGVTEELRKDLDEKEKRLADEAYDEMQRSAENVEIKPGMDVLCGRYKREGTVIERAGRGEWRVAIGSMRFTFKESELTVPLREKKVSSYAFEGIMNNKMPKLTLDLRGYRLEEALSAMDNQLESCVLYGMKEFSVIHGYGDGILSAGIHNFLRTKELVQSYNFALPDDGGQGKTYVRLK